MFKWLSSLVFKPKKQPQVMASHILRAIKPVKKMGIISLTNQEINKLHSIDYYKVSIEHLQKNQLGKALMHLQLSLSEAQTRFPYSINLHGCLLNRMSILYKLLNRQKQFIETLQQQFLWSLSGKGHKSLDTHKHLNNYLIALMTYQSQKAVALVNLIKTTTNYPKLANLDFFDGYLDIVYRQNAEQGLRKLSSIVTDNEHEEFIKLNNLTWMTYLTLNNVPAGRTKQEKLQECLKGYVKSLLISESVKDEEITTNRLEYLQYFLRYLNRYLNGETFSLINPQITPERSLCGPQSHIIVMNIAQLLFDISRFEECALFLKIGLRKATQLGEPERVGLGLIFMARMYRLESHGNSWEKMLLVILENCQKYSRGIVQQALRVYSGLLIDEGRLFEAEGYFRQAQALEAGITLEGLILPDYDFAY